MLSSIALAAILKSLEAMQARLISLERANGDSRHRVLELERELEVCRLEVERAAATKDHNGPRERTPDSGFGGESDQMEGEWERRYKEVLQEKRGKHPSISVTFAAGI